MELGCATLGIGAYIVHIEADISSQNPAFSVEGLPDSAVKESRDRVMAAIKNVGRSLPNNRITVNVHQVLLLTGNEKHYKYLPEIRISKFVA